MEIGILQVVNLKWANAEKTAIDMEVRFSHLPSSRVAFTAVKGDSEAHGRELYARALAGEYGSIAPYSRKSTQSGSRLE